MRVHFDEHSDTIVGGNNRSQHLVRFKSTYGYFVTRCGRIIHRRTQTVSLELPKCGVCFQ